MTTRSGDGLRAIETRYNGYRFRSRLEARWAVFFDAIGLPWRYEAEGFDLDGVWYLPDFWLPDHDLFIEIKPTYPLIPKETGKALRLASRSEKAVLILAGDCWPGAYRIIDCAPHIWKSEVFDEHYTGEFEYTDCWDCSALARCRRCDGLCVIHYSDEYGGDWLARSDRGRHDCRDHDKSPIPFSKSSYESARSARFEHCDNGPMRGVGGGIAPQMGPLEFTRDT